MTTAATHYGECQLCGHQQKLPNGGKLSIHGYSVKWNMFLGTCEGSRHLPYEQSSDLLADQIVRQRGVIADRHEFIATITAPGYTTLYVTEYLRKANNGKGGYVPRVLDASEYEVKESKYDGFSFFRIVWTTQDGQQSKIDPSDSMSSAADIIAHANSTKVRELQKDIAQREDYIVWLQARIDSFKVRDLTAIPEGERGTKARTMHMSRPMYGYKHASACSGSAMGAQKSSYSHAMTEDASKVTCVRCLKDIAARAARAAAKQ